MARALVRTLLALATFVAAAHPGRLAAQLIPVRTVPVASGDQFLLMPSRTLGMGGVTLAVDDTLADPWTNPAKGARIREPVLLGSPTLYAISSDGGGGRSFPVAVQLRGDRWFGGLAFALQQIDNERGGGTDFLVRSDVWPGWFPPSERLSDASARNVYVSAFLGTRVGDGPWSAGLGLSAAGLDAMDGVDLLYANAERIEQNGTVGDVSFGLYRDGSRDRLALLLLHDRVSMTHEVSFVDVTWLQGGPVAHRRVEENLDHTRTWAFQTEYDRDLRAPGWRLGASATVNRKSHPKIPDYDIQNIPRDPGETWAYEMGVGLSRTRGPTQFGLDVVFQPIWSDTWQVADEKVTTSTGGVIPAGGRTIENDFFFSNVVLRTGLSHDMGSVTVQGGLELRSYDYTLDQRDHVAGTFRDQDEAWMEWSPSAGATFRFGDVALRYAGRLTTGTGQPGIALTADAAAERTSLADFIVAPRGPLSLQEATVVTHQLSVAIPIR